MYNPLAAYLSSLMDSWITSYAENCERANHPIRLDEFKNVVNDAYQQGRISPKVAQILVTKFQQRYA